jgi:hypothetical protein
MYNKRNEPVSVENYRSCLIHIFHLYSDWCLWISNDWTERREEQDFSSKREKNECFLFIADRHAICTCMPYPLPRTWTLILSEAWNERGKRRRKPTLATFKREKSRGIIHSVIILKWLKHVIRRKMMIFPCGVLFDLCRCNEKKKNLRWLLQSILSVSDS